MKVYKSKKIGKNRGFNRLWIEGGMLLNHGWRKGQLFNVEYTKTTVRIVRDNDHGTNHVAGTDSRPIIDLNNANVPSSEHTYKMVIHDGLITLKQNKD